jgi:hypothetical protein
MEIEKKDEVPAPPGPPAPTAKPATRKLSGKRKSATLDLNVPEGYEVEKSWQVRDVKRVKESIDAELAKNNELYVITIRGPKKEE